LGGFTNFRPARGASLASDFARFAAAELKVHISAERSGWTRTTFLTVQAGFPVEARPTSLPKHT